MSATYALYDSTAVRCVPKLASSASDSSVKQRRIISLAPRSSNPNSSLVSTRYIASKVEGSDQKMPLTTIEKLLWSFWQPRTAMFDNARSNLVGGARHLTTSCEIIVELLK